MSSGTPSSVLAREIVREWQRLRDGVNGAGAGAFSYKAHNYQHDLERFVTYHEQNVLNILRAYADAMDATTQDPTP